MTTKLHCCQVLIGHLNCFTLVQKVKTGHTKFMLLLIHQGCAETLQVISFKNDLINFLQNMKLELKYHHFKSHTFSTI